jgi:hypothetical protein
MSPIPRVARLEAVDVKKRDGFWCIEIKKAKTRASERIVPLHQDIIDQGFIDFVKSREGERLFGEKRASNEALIKCLRRWLHSIDGLNLGRKNRFDQGRAFCADSNGLAGLRPGRAFDRRRPRLARGRCSGPPVTTTRTKI